MLQVRNLYSGYGNLKVLFDISLDVYAGEVVCLVGRNGAGKTTLFRTLAGFIKPFNGEILFKQEFLIGMLPYRIALSGLKYVHQDKQVFSDLTVKENLELASYATKDYDWDRVFTYLPKLKILTQRKAGLLSGGEKQMLLIAMALLGKPALVLMDEPTEGLAPHLIQDLTESFKEIRKETTLFIVEQNLPMVTQIADTVYSMREGKIVAKTTSPEEIRALAFEKHL
ncbi:MAG: ABC transporter ATP-binding protein [Spirochaetales bacterium]